METAPDCNKVREEVLSLFIYTWVSMKIFLHFTVKKKSFPLPAERGFCIYIQWLLINMQWEKSVCGCLVTRVSRSMSVANRG